MLEFIDIPNHQPTIKLCESGMFEGDATFKRFKTNLSAGDKLLVWSGYLQLHPKEVFSVLEQAGALSLFIKEEEIWLVHIRRIMHHATKYTISW